MSHEHNQGTNTKVLMFAFIFTLLFAILEVSYGFISNSLALLSEGIHMLSDGFSLGLAALAVILATKAINNKRMFGYRRAEPIAAFLNGIGLMVIPVVVMIEAVNRMFNGGQDILSKEMLIVAVIGLVMNLVVAIALSRGEKSNINVRAALLHIVADLISSTSTIAVSLLIMFFDFVIIDAIASFVVSIIIFTGGYKITKESLNILMEGSPDDIDAEELKTKILAIEGVKSIAHLKVWCIAEDEKYMTVHIEVDNVSKSSEILQLVQKINTESHLRGTIQIN